MRRCMVGNDAAFCRRGVTVSAPRPDFGRNVFERPVIRWTIRFEWKPADCWVGVFWRHSAWSQPGHSAGRHLDIWVCVLPMVPLHLLRTVTLDEASP